jgi:hypothetical protein
MGLFEKFTGTFSAHRPAIDHVPESRKQDTPIGKIVSEWRQRGGELISLKTPENPTDFSSELLNPTVMSHMEINRQPITQIGVLKELSVLSINLDALGRQRDDSKNRARDTLNIEEKQFLDFLRKDAKDADAICLQDFPIYRLRLLGREINTLGFSWYGNVNGINDNAPGHLTSQVTLFNARKFALKGFRVQTPALSLTPHFQGTHRVKVGEKGVEVRQGEPDWKEAYGPRFRPESVDHHATQTFNTTFEVEGVDGKRIVSIGNTYVAAPSFMVERSKSLRYVLQNEKKLAGDGVAIVTGDMNTYGYDAAQKQFGRHTYPVTTIASMAVSADAKEVAHIQKVGERLGFMKADLGNKHTILAPMNLAGMQLDHLFAAGVQSVTAQPVPVSFTDHEAVVSRIIL